MAISLPSLLFLTSLIVGIMGTIIIVAQRSENKAHIFLGAFVFCSSSGAIFPILGVHGMLEQYPVLIYLPFDLNILALPFLYAFLAEISGTFNNKKTPIIFIIPSVVILSYFYFWSLPDAEKIVHLSDMTWRRNMMAYRKIDILHNMVFIFICLIQVKRYEHRVDDYFSEGLSRGFVWIKVLCYYSFALYIILLIPREMFPRGSFRLISNTFTATNILLVLWIVIDSSKHNFKSIPPEHSEDLALDDLISKDPVPTSISKDANQVAQIAALFSKAPYYRKKDLNLQFLAKELGMSPRRLSNLINQETGKNFRSYINSFRIEYAKKQIEDGVLKNMSIDGLAIDSGFNSRTTFYTVFKQETGSTPIEYLQQQTNQG